MLTNQERNFACEILNLFSLECEKVFAINIYQSLYTGCCRTREGLDINIHYNRPVLISVDTFISICDTQAATSA